MNHIIERSMTSLVYGIALGMIWRSEDLLDPQGVQRLSPNIADEFSAVVGEEPASSAEVGDHVAQEGFAQPCSRCDCWMERGWCISNSNPRTR